MNAKELKEAITVAFELDVCLFVWGPHGIGKSSIPAAWCKERGWKLFDFRLNTQADVGDILGLQDFVKCPDTGKITSVTHYQPQWLMDSIKFCEENPDKGAVLFFDELNRASRMDMVGPIFQMALDKRLHTLKFPPNLKIIVASNPSTEDYSVLDLTDKALLDRFLHVKFAPTRAEFLSFVKSNPSNETKEVSEMLMFLTEHPEFMEREGEEFNISEFASPSRRTWELYVTALLKFKAEGKVTDSTFKKMLEGLVGLEVSVSFLKYLEESKAEDKAVDGKLIISEYKKHKDIIAKQKETNRVDILNSTIDSILVEVKDEKFKPTKAKMKNLVDFCLDLPTDLGMKLYSEFWEETKLGAILIEIEYREDDLIEFFKDVK